MLLEGNVFKMQIWPCVYLAETFQCLMIVSLIQDQILPSLWPHPFCYLQKAELLLASTYIRPFLAFPWPLLLCASCWQGLSPFCEVKYSHFIRLRSAFPISLSPAWVWHLPLPAGKMVRCPLSSVGPLSLYWYWNSVPASVSRRLAYMCFPAHASVPAQCPEQCTGSHWWFLNWDELPCKHLGASLRHCHIWFSLYPLSQCLAHPQHEKVPTEEPAGSVTPSVFLIGDPRYTNRTVSFPLQRKNCRWRCSLLEGGLLWDPEAQLPPLLLFTVSREGSS